MLKNGLIKKFRSVSKYMMPSTGKPIRSKRNQVMKFGQLIKCNVRNIFLQK